MLEFIQDQWMNNRMTLMLVAVLIVVAPFIIYYVIAAHRHHPKGLIAAALSNMGERFGYYIMNAVLLLFLCSKFGISDDAAGWIYAIFYFLIYVLSLRVVSSPTSSRIIRALSCRAFWSWLSVMASWLCRFLAATRAMWQPGCLC